MDDDATAAKPTLVEQPERSAGLDRLNVRTMSTRGVRAYAVAMGLIMALQTLMMVALRPRPVRPWRVLLPTAGSLATGVGMVYMMRGLGLMTNAWEGRTDEERRAMVQAWMRRMADKYGDGAACPVDQASSKERSGSQQ